MNRISQAILLVVLISASASFVPLGFAASGQWSKSGSPVLSPTPNSWDSDSVTSPKAVYSGGVYRIWYQGSHSGQTAIGYANSTDGVNWIKYGSPVLSPGPSGSWDSSGIALGSVLWDGTVFRMWYSGNSPVAFPNGAFGLATSPDGISWAKFGGNPVMTPSEIDKYYMTSPFVIRQSLTYNMWYSGRSITDSPSSQVTRILYAYSFDGITWNKWPSTVLDPSTSPNAWDSISVYSPSVIFDGTTYGMWYSGLGQSLLTPQIGYATSPDGSTWTKSLLNPILSPGDPGNWDSAGVEQPSATFAKGFMLYYSGFAKTSGSAIGLAYPPQEFKIPEFPNSTLLVLFGVLASMTFLALNRRSRRGFADRDVNLS